MFIKFNILYYVFHSNIYDYVETRTGFDTLQPWTDALGTGQCQPQEGEDLPIGPVQTTCLMGAHASVGCVLTLLHSVYVA